jgi:hypothetical protein
MLEQEQAESKNPVRWVGRFHRGARLARAKHFADAAFEQLVLAAKVDLEGRPPNIGARQNLLHGNRIVRLLVNQRCERTVKKATSLLNLVSTEGARFPLLKSTL